MRPVGAVAWSPENGAPRARLESGLVYAVAAYSITLGVLLVYGVVIHHRTRLVRAELALRARGDRARDFAAGVLFRGFNLGAALLAPLWSLVHGPRAAALALIAAWIACIASQLAGNRLVTLVLASFLLGSALFMGAVGNRLLAARIAAPQGEAEDPFALAGRQARWALAGALLYTVVLPWACYFWVGAA